MSAYDDPLRVSLKSAINGISDPDQIVEAVMLLLGKAHLISYSNSPVKLLSTTGRVLADIACHPGSSSREISVRLALSEHQVMKHITDLWNNSLIEKKQKQHHFGYFCDLQTLLENGDIQSVLQGVFVTAKSFPDESYEPPAIT